MFPISDGDEDVGDDGVALEAEEQPLPFKWVGSGGQSRLQSEFSFLCNLGKGGFGEVFKVKNNLDSQIYAIKRIKVNPKNTQLTKKLKREVQLLSRLNHENVVRYYNSWIEATPAPDFNDEINDGDGNSETSFEDESKDQSLRFSPEAVNQSISINFEVEAEADIFGTSFLPFR